MTASDEPCTCGHTHRLHWGDGPCLACVSGGRGTSIAGSVCPCTAFEQAVRPESLHTEQQEIAAP